MARFWAVPFLVFLSDGLAYTTSSNPHINTNGFHVPNQCPNVPPGNLQNTNPRECPLPGHLGIIPDLPSSMTISWSHPPHCLPVSQTNRLDCLFSYHPFRNGHGISVITSTTTMSNLVGDDVFSDRPVPPAAAKRGRAGNAYEIVDVPGRGKGAIAKRTIKRGEILMVDVPAVLVSISFLTEMKPHLRRRVMKRALGQLPREMRERVEGLAKGTGHEVDAIFGTNTESVVLGKQDGEEEGGEVHVGLFAEIARINHSCRPKRMLKRINCAYYRFSPRRLTMEVVAYTTIEPGDEILLSYTPLGMAHTPRRKYLQQNWGFDCACSLCRASDLDISDSEGRRRQMNDLRETMLDAKKNGYFKDAIAIAHDWRDFAEWEGLPLLMPEYHDILAELHYLKGDLANASTYARMAVDEWTRFGSVDGSKVEKASVFLNEVYLQQTSS